jgi:alpha-tubulin suppressor-like RCC1 family protein
MTRHVRVELAAGRWSARRSATTLAALGAALCALLAGGLTSAAAQARVMAWGSNRDGQLGSESRAFSDIPVSVSGLGEVTQVVASNHYSLALLSNGQVWSWGTERNGVLGNGESSGYSSVPVQVIGLTEVKAIAGTHGYNLALLRDGEVMAWGNDKDGRLGNGIESGFSETPEPVNGLTEVTAIATGQFHALALLKNGSVMAWGHGSRGSLGDGEELSSTPVPVPVEGITEAAAVASGNVYSLVLLRNGTVLSFGASEFGQLGDGHRTPSYVPVPVKGLSEVTAISAGGWNNLALLQNGTVMAWGWDKSGELGNGDRTGPERCEGWGCTKLPIPVSGLTEVTAISAASNTFEQSHNLNCMALRKNGTVMAWGGNEVGQLGDGTTKNSYTPTEVVGLTGVTSISAGGWDSLAAVG